MSAEGAVLLPVAGAAATRRALRARLRPYRGLLALGGALFLGRSLVGLVAPAVLGRIVDAVVDGRPASALSGPVVVLVLAALAEGLLAWLGPAVAAQAGETALADLREEVVDRALHVPLGDVERAGTGDLVARVDGDVGAVGQAIQEAFPAVVEAGLTIALTVVGLAVLDWRLALAGLCAAPIQFHTLRWYLPRSKPLYASERVAASARSQQLLDTVGGASTVRALGLAPQHTGLVADRSQRAVNLAVASVWLRTRFFARLNLAEFVGLGAILATGFVLHRDGAVTVGAVTAAALYFQRIFDPVNGLLYLLDEAQSAGAALARLVGVAELPLLDDVPPDAGDGRPAGSAARSGGAAVEVVGVEFAYDHGHPVLHGIDLRVAHGEHVAVVGASGAGKTTVAKLVAGVHHPDAGTVTVAGSAVAAAGRRARPAVALVTQEVHVFAGTLRDDLRLGRPGATDDELLGVLDLVGAGGWWGALPEGLDTIVGDGGHHLDATQAQQLALARLILVDPLVVVLDEATAEAGSAGARVLETAAAAALDGRTALVVAHRLSQAAAADRIVVLEGGRLVETGSHDELLAGGGLYHELWQAWSGHDAPTVGHS